jgi:hypothetical protein
MSDRPGNLETRREAAALALARGLSIRDAAAEAGVNERTVFNYRTDPVFNARVKELRAELFALAVAKLAGMNGKAADQLAGLLESGDEKTRLGAVRLVADWTKAAREHDLAAEIEALRQELQEIKRNVHGPAPRPGETTG